MTLAENVLNSQVRAIARALSWIENGHEGKEKLIDALFPHCGRAMVLGITGPPGAGKSTLTDQIIQRERAAGRTVGVIAVDPSSPFSGGAILGDRVRMQRHAIDDGVFIRSMASRGHLGGVSGATGDAIKVLDAAGYDTVILETIGVGQTEIEVMELADIVLLVMVPGLGDEIQALKAGVMEIGDIFIVNKADRDDAAKVKAEIDYVLEMRYAGRLKEKSPVVMTSSTENIGLDEMHQTIASFYTGMKTNGMLITKRRKRIADELRHIASRTLEDKIHRLLRFEQRMDGWVNALMSGEAAPYGLIREKIEPLIKEMFHL